MSRIDYRQTEKAKKGRNGDKYMAHVAEGELIVPPVISDELRQAIYDEMTQMGIDPQEFEVSGEKVKINPETGEPEFFFKGIKRALKKIVSNPVFKIALPFVLGPAGFGLSTLASAGVGAGLGAISGQGLKGIAAGALGAASGGLGNSLGSGIAGATGLKAGLSNALGRGIVSSAGSKLGGASTNEALLSGGLSGLGSLYQSGAFNNTGTAFKEGGLSGALSQFDANTAGTGDVLRASGGAAPTKVGGGGSSSFDNKSGTTFLNNGDSIKWDTTAPVNNGLPAVDFNSVPAPVAEAPKSILDTATDKIGDSMKNKDLFEGVLNSGLSTYSNNKAANQMLKLQKQGLADLQPILNRQFDTSNLENDAGYQFQLGQGLKALDSANAARGNFYSGDALRAAGAYTRGLADTTVNDAFGRFTTARNQDLAAVGQKYGVLGDIGSTKAQSTMNKNQAYMDSISRYLNPQKGIDELLLKYLGSRA